MEIDYKEKYLKYKHKYLELRGSGKNEPKKSKEEAMKRKEAIKQIRKHIDLEKLDETKISNLIKLYEVLPINDFIQIQESKKGDYKRKLDYYDEVIEIYNYIKDKFNGNIEYIIYLNKNLSIKYNLKFYNKIIVNNKLENLKKFIDKLSNKEILKDILKDISHLKENNDFPKITDDVLNIINSISDEDSIKYIINDINNINGVIESNINDIKKINTEKFNNFISNLKKVIKQYINEEDNKTNSLCKDFNSIIKYLITLDTEINFEKIESIEHFGGECYNIIEKTHNTNN